jgi:UDP-N-acetylmuramate--alanine ligase
MHIYFSGLGGVGIGPLCEIAQDAGYIVSGSDLVESPMTKALEERGVSVKIGQDGSQIATVQQSRPIDWFVYTAALPDDHPELAFAREHGIRASKRDELLAHIIKDKSLKLIAVSGTHGKTNTTGMLVWLLQKTGVPVSYSVGATLSFGPSGKYDPLSKFFVYECDEYDRNFLHFEPWTSVITSVDYDHPNTYPTVDEYKQAFVDFIDKSSYTYMWKKDYTYLGEERLKPLFQAIDATKPKGFVVFDDETIDVSVVTLPGKHSRQNGFLAASLVADGLGHTEEGSPEKRREIFELLKDFPGTDRRVEKLAENLYTDYGHHPVEIGATLQLARELSDEVVLVYQPHQNLRQHRIKDEYTDCMELAEKIYWLPTYLSRENHLRILTPEELSANLTNKDAVTVSEMNGELWQNIMKARNAGKLVLVMGAGDIDGWVREHVAQLKTTSTP